jgi:sulfur-carrier protein adenylyltransferase/sulfurtransferase
MLTPDETRRYARHLSLPGFGVAGQERLKGGSVLCIGAGGLGSPALMYLAAAGVGRLGIVDADVVDESNLQRQLLFGTSDVGRPKAEAAAARLRDLNPLIEIEPHRVRLTRDNAEELVSRYDILLDGTDNFPTRYLCNDVAVRLRKPNVHGAIHRFEGQVSVFAPHLGGPCYRCLFPEPPPPGTVPSCAEGGVLGVLPGLVGTLQATEAIKLLAGLGSPLVGRLLHVDALTLRHREIRLRRDPECALCGEAPTLFELPDYPLTCEATASVPGLSVAAFAALRAAGSAYTLLDVREPEEVAAVRFPESIAIPLGQLEERLGELPEAPRPLVIHCKAGGRSARALALLAGHGIAGEMLNLTGGLDAWLAENGPPA